MKVTTATIIALITPIKTNRNPIGISTKGSAILPSGNIIIVTLYLEKISEVIVSPNTYFYSRAKIPF